jgi:amidase
MTLHHFRPAHYYTTMGSHAPVLTIGPGDSVVTTTVDAGGSDESGRQITPPSNPMTGPFYVQSAEPGDTLAVTFEAMAPNRRTGYTRSVIAAHVVDPDYARELPEMGEVAWDLDVAAGTAKLGHLAGFRTLSRGQPGGAGRGDERDFAALREHLTLALAPMLGCFGVAPAGGQAISTATSGPYGGNMDYRGFAPGVTVYLPVAVPGALFFLGDGHAVQGDGEIIGTGIETSFEVQFKVEVRRNWPISWPRGENAEYIFTAGNARPLDQAVQHATTEMLRWLAADYGLGPRSASVLLGQCVAYDLGNFYDPAYTMICKVSKRVLGGLRRS